MFLISVTPKRALGTGKSGVYLDRLMLEVVNVCSMNECFNRCLQQPYCLSVNFLKADQHHDNICVLNAATTKEHYAVISPPGASYNGSNIDEWVYLELVN